jgi:hypothetical protein
MNLSHYDEVLQEAREKGELIANKYIFELYAILRDEEYLPPEDCRAKIEQDCIDLWSKATIRKFLPEEAKNPKKSKAGKIGAGQRKKFEEEEKLKTSQLVEQTIDGNIISTATSSDSSNSGGSSGARTNPAENDSFCQEEEESRRFHAEFTQYLGGRVPSPEIIEAVRLISLKDKRIKELEDLTGANSNEQINSELYLPAKIAQEIHDIIDINRTAGTTETDFILRHDGSQILAVESLNGVNPNSAVNRMMHDEVDD